MYDLYPWGGSCFIEECILPHGHALPHVYEIEEEDDEG